MKSQISITTKRKLAEATNAVVHFNRLNEQDLSNLMTATAKVIVEATGEDVTLFIRQEPKDEEGVRPDMRYWDMLCKLQPYSFMKGPDGGVIKWADHSGNWIERSEAQRVMDLAQAKVNELEQQVADLKAAADIVKDCRGYAALGDGHYLLNDTCNDGVPGFIISLASEAQAAGREIGDLQPTDGQMIEPHLIVVRMDFKTEKALDAVERQLGIVRKEYFPDSVPGYEHQRSIMEAERNESSEAWAKARGRAISLGDVISYEAGFTNGWDRRGAKKGEL